MKKKKKSLSWAFGRRLDWQMTVFSVYPARGNPHVRDQLHRRIQPRVKSADGEVRIMWSSTRLDMEGSHWIPNHFVPVLHLKPTVNGTVSGVGNLNCTTATNRDKKGGNEVHANAKTEAESVETDPGALKQETDVSIALQVQFPEHCLETYVLVEYDG